MIERVLIVGTGLIGTSVGLALKAAGFAGSVTGWDESAQEREAATASGGFNALCATAEEALQRARGESGLIVLAVPVLAIMDWMQRLAPVLGPHHLVTDVGSTKQAITELARRLYGRAGGAHFLPGHPMAGKESGGAALAEAGLFRGATWLFTPSDREADNAAEAEWRAWVVKFGAHAMDLDAARHDAVCAWVSHLPQMLATALAALLEEEFGADAAGREEISAIGGRALREMTRLGASPYTMWRDVALSNTQPIAATLHALEQRLAHVRENLRTLELREEFRLANAFRARR